MTETTQEQNLAVEIFKAASTANCSCSANSFPLSSVRVFRRAAGVAAYRRAAAWRTVAACKFGTLPSNKWFKRRYTREQVREGIEVCKSCHRAIHDLVPDEKQLGRHYNTLEKLLTHPEIGKFVQWKRERARNDEQGSKK